MVSAANTGGRGVEVPKLVPDKGTRRVPMTIMSQSTQEHRATAPAKLRCAVITISDTRTLENDTGGEEVVRHLLAAPNK